MTDLAARAPEWIKAMLHETGTFSLLSTSQTRSSSLCYLAGGPPHPPLPLSSGRIPPCGKFQRPGKHADFKLAELSAGLCLYLATERADYLAGRWMYVNRIPQLFRTFGGSGLIVCSDARWDMEELEGKKDEIVEKNLLTMGLLA